MDELIYVILAPEIPHHPFYNPTALDNRNGNRVSGEDSWDDAKADTPRAWPTVFGLEWNVKTPSAVGARINDNVPYPVHTEVYAGTVISSAYKYAFGRTSLIADTTFSIDGNNHVLSSGTGTGTGEDTDLALTLGIESEVLHLFVTSEPANSPFNGANSAGQVYVRRSTYTSPAGLTNEGVKVYADISSALTSQA